MGTNYWTFGKVGLAMALIVLVAQLSIPMVSASDPPTSPELTTVESDDPRFQLGYDRYTIRMRDEGGLSCGSHWIWWLLG